MQSEMQNKIVEHGYEEPVVKFTKLTCEYCLPQLPQMNGLALWTVMCRFKVRSCINILLQSVHGYIAPFDDMYGLPADMQYLSGTFHNEHSNVIVQQIMMSCAVCTYKPMDEKYGTKTIQSLEIHFHHHPEIYVQWYVSEQCISDLRLNTVQIIPGHWTTELDKLSSHMLIYSHPVWCTRTAALAKRHLIKLHWVTLS